MRRLYETWFGAVFGKLRRREAVRILRLRPNGSNAPINILVATWRDIRIANEMFIDDPYLQFLPDSVRRSAEPLVIDVGANRGYFCLHLANVLDRPRVVALEPEPTNVALLRANLALNGLTDRVEVVDAAAVADGSATVALYIAHEPALHSTIGPGERGRRGLDENRLTGTTVEVAARNLDKELQARIGQSGAVDILKIDTEGTELDLLAALGTDTLHGVRYIVAELEGGGSPEADAAAARLRDAGFQALVEAPYIYAWRG